MRLPKNSSVPPKASGRHGFMKPLSGSNSGSPPSHLIIKVLIQRSTELVRLIDLTKCIAEEGEQVGASGSDKRAIRVMNIVVDVPKSYIKLFTYNYPYLRFRLLTDISRDIEQFQFDGTTINWPFCKIRSVI